MCSDDAEEEVDAADTSILDTSIVSEDGHTHADSDSHSQEAAETQQQQQLEETPADVEADVVPQEESSANIEAPAPATESAPQHEVAAPTVSSEIAENAPASESTAEPQHHTETAAVQDDEHDEVLVGVHDDGCA